MQLKALVCEHAARQPGVKVVIEQHSGDEDEEEWDEVMSELVDPWVQGPGGEQGVTHTHTHIHTQSPINMICTQISYTHVHIQCACTHACVHTGAVSESYSTHARSCGCLNASQTT